MYQVKLIRNPLTLKVIWSLEPFNFLRSNYVDYSIHKDKVRSLQQLPLHHFVEHSSLLDYSTCKDRNRFWE